MEDALGQYTRLYYSPDCETPNVKRQAKHTEAQGERCENLTVHPPGESYSPNVSSPRPCLRAGFCMIGIKFIKRVQLSEFRWLSGSFPGTTLSYR